MNQIPGTGTPGWPARADMTWACRSASGATKSCLSGTCTRNTSSRRHSAPSGPIQDAVTKMVFPEYPASGADRSRIRTS